MIKQFDRQTVKNLRAELDEVLADFGKKHGIVVQMGTARFTATSVNWKLNMVCPAAAGNGNVADSVEGCSFWLIVPCMVWTKVILMKRSCCVGFLTQSSE